MRHVNRPHMWVWCVPKNLFSCLLISGFNGYWKFMPLIDCQCDSNINIINIIIIHIVVYYGKWTLKNLFYCLYTFTLTLWILKIPLIQSIDDHFMFLFSQKNFLTLSIFQDLSAHILQIEFLIINFSSAIFKESFWAERGRGRPRRLLKLMYWNSFNRLEGMLL